MTYAESCLLDNCNSNSECEFVFVIANLVPA